MTDVGTGLFRVEGDTGPLERDMARARAAVESAMRRMQTSARAFDQGLGRVEQSSRRVEASSRRMANGMRRAQNEVAGTTRQLQAAARAAQALAAALAVRQLVGYADAWVGLRSRIALAVGSHEDAERAMSALFEIAQRTGAEIGALGDLFFRTARQADRFGLSQDQVLAITEAVALSSQTTGASAQEAAAGIRQLSQAFQRGALLGDEFVTISESMPFVLEAVKAELIALGRATEDNVDVMILEMREAGQITAPLLARAMINNLGLVRQQFEDLGPSADRGLTRVFNVLRKISGQAGETSGATKALEDAFTDLADALDNNAFIDFITNVLAQYVRYLAFIADLTKSAAQAVREFGQGVQAVLGDQEARDLIGGRRVVQPIPGGGAPAIPPAPELGPVPDEEAAKRLKKTTDDLKDAIKEAAFEIERAALPEKARDVLDVLEEFGVDVSSLRDAKGDIAGLVDEFARLTPELERIRQAEGIAAAIKELQDQVAIGDPALEDYRELNELFQELEINALAYKDALVLGNVATEEQKAAAQELFDLYQQRLEQTNVEEEEFLITAEDLASRGASTFGEMATEADNLGDVFDSLIKSLIRMTLEAAAFALIMRGFNAAGFGGFLQAPAASAHGNVFDSGRIVPMQHGGIISRPTIRPLRNGAALMGEAGTEGVLPLTRLPSGDLGVQTMSDRDDGGAMGPGGDVFNIDARGSQVGAAAEWYNRLANGGTDMIRGDLAHKQRYSGARNQRRGF